MSTIVGVLLIRKHRGEQKAYLLGGIKIMDNIFEFNEGSCFSQMRRKFRLGKAGRWKISDFNQRDIALMILNSSIRFYTYN